MCTVGSGGREPWKTSGAPQAISGAPGQATSVRSDARKGIGGEGRIFLHEPIQRGLK
jgi:hypothetical protein